MKAVLSLKKYDILEKKLQVVEVEFGSPMKNCLHYGICRVSIPRAAGRKPCSCWSMASVYPLSDNLLQFVFDKNKMNKKAYDKYFKSGFFQIDDKYELPPEILYRIGLEKHVIKEGKYPVLIENEKIKITF